MLLPAMICIRNIVSYDVFFFYECHNFCAPNYKPFKNDEAVVNKIQSN